MKCLKCGKELDKYAPRSGISIFVMGDEYIYTYVYCRDCNEYTVEVYHDRFMGEDDIHFFSVDKRKGDKAIELIEACPEPHNKNCDCPSHKALYHGVP